LPDRLLVVNQVLGPLMVQLLSRLAERGVRCRAVTGWVDAEDPRSLPFEVRPAARLVKQPALKRIVTWGLFTLQALGAMVRHRDWPMLIVTNPPLVMLAASVLRRLAGIRYVLLVYDIYPDVMERMGMLRPGGWVARLWRRRSAAAIAGAEAVITLGEHMAETLAGHVPPGRARPDIVVIPNWADTDNVRPMPKPDNEFAVEHGLADKFVVAYSGSFGATHDTASILDAAGRLADRSDVRFLLIGGGTRQREIADAIQRNHLNNLTLLPFQPPDRFPRALASADCLIVCLDAQYAGISVPSKTYSCLAAGAAILAISPPETELVDMLARHEVGIHIPPGRGDLLADAIEQLRRDPDRLTRFRHNARALAVSEYSVAAGTDRYAKVLAPLAGARRA
jgi:glycosyltransferase involved in cell wall biosynthesis